MMYSCGSEKLVAVCEAAGGCYDLVFVCDVVRMQICSHSTVGTLLIRMTEQAFANQDDQDDRAGLC
jgi:hypothetical protein